MWLYPKVIDLARLATLCSSVGLNVIEVAHVMQLPSCTLCDWGTESPQLITLDSLMYMYSSDGAVWMTSFWSSLTIYRYTSLQTYSEASNTCDRVSVSSHKTQMKEKSYVHVAIMRQGEHSQCGQWRKPNKVGMAISNSLCLPCCSVPPVAPLCVGSSWPTSCTGLWLFFVNKPVQPDLWRSLSVLSSHLSSFIYVPLCFQIVLIILLNLLRPCHAEFPGFIHRYSVVSIPYHKLGLLSTPRY